MSRLSEKLMQVYTSGDSMTVLALLNKLIKTVEDYEIEESDKHLYRHNIKLNFSDSGGPYVTYFDIYTDSSEAFTLDALLTSALGDITANGCYYSAQSATGYTIAHVTLGYYPNSQSYVNIVTNAPGTQRVQIPSTATVTDTVTQIF